MPAENDRERNLQRLADENGYWAEKELRLIKAIREHKRKLAGLPDIIHRLGEERERVAAEMLRTGREYDALIAEDADAMRLKIWERARAKGNAELGAMSDAEFWAWVNDQADEYSDFLLTTQPPRPNPFGLFREPG